jgi:hypothetical protein
MRNQMGGGRTFATGGPINLLSSAPSSVVNNVVNNNGNESLELINKVRALRRQRLRN